MNEQNITECWTLFRVSWRLCKIIMRSANLSKKDISLQPPVFSPSLLHCVYFRKPVKFWSSEMYPVYFWELWEIVDVASPQVFEVNQDVHCVLLANCPKFRTDLSQCNRNNFFFFKVQADLNRKLFFLEQCLLIQYSLDVREKEAWKESFWNFHL